MVKPADVPAKLLRVISLLLEVKFLTQRLFELLNHLLQPIASAKRCIIGDEARNLLHYMNVHLNQLTNSRALDFDNDLAATC